MRGRRFAGIVIDGHNSRARAVQVTINGLIFGTKIYFNLSPLTFEPDLKTLLNKLLAIKSIIIEDN